MSLNRTLNDTVIGESVIVEKLLMHGAMRRHLLDIGLTEGARVGCIGRSPTGDPTAYLIRGAVIAIRAEDSREILIREENGVWD